MAMQTPSKPAAKPSITAAQIRRLQIIITEVKSTNDPSLLSINDLDLMLNALAALADVRATMHEAITDLLPRKG